VKVSGNLAAIFDRVIDFLGFLAGVVLVVLMLVMCYEVVMRYFFARPPAWAVEVAEYMLFFIAFLGAAWLLKMHGHVRVDIVAGRLNPKARAMLNIITSILGVIICLLLTWYGGETAWSHFQRGVLVAKVLELPKGPFLILISLGCFLLSIEFLRQAYTHVNSWRKTKVEGS